MTWSPTLARSIGPGIVPLLPGSAPSRYAQTSVGFPRRYSAVARPATRLTSTMFGSGLTSVSTAGSVSGGGPLPCSWPPHPSTTTATTTEERRMLVVRGALQDPVTNLVDSVLRERHAVREHRGIDLWHLRHGQAVERALAAVRRVAG